MSSAQDDHFRFRGAKRVGQEPLTADSLDENLTSVIITVTTRMNSQALWENLQKVFDVVSEETFAESVEKLRFFFSETLILAALDLIDRDSVIAYNTPWGRTQYEVLGSTATYAVFPGLPGPGIRPLAYCTCPAYAYTVLLSDTQIMCKHVLATLLARRLSRCVERPASANDLVPLIARQCTLST